MKFSMITPLAIKWSDSGSRISECSIN